MVSETFVFKHDFILTCLYFFFRVKFIVFWLFQTDWFDLVSFEQLREDLDQKVHAWERKRRVASIDESNTEESDDLSRKKYYVL